MTRKYHNKKLTVEGETFDSKREYKRWLDLRKALDMGHITNLCRQIPFTLIPAQREESTEVYTKGVNKGKPKPGRLLERPVEYIADFMYTKNGKVVVEDVKGVRTKEYIIKRKLMLYMYGIKISEIR